MSAKILYMPNRFERHVLNYFRSIKGDGRGAAKKYATVFGQIYYYSVCMPQGFYKFKQPCKGNPLYREGDSWEESLGMTKAMFNPIFNDLVKLHKSKTEYMNSTDKFEGKMFCSYMECGKGVNKTFYHMNTELVYEIFPYLKSEMATGEKVLSRSEKVKYIPLGVEENRPLLAGARLTAFNTHTTTSLTSDTPKIDSEPKVEMRSEEEDLILNQVKNSPPIKPDDPSQTSQSVSTNEKMLEIFNEHTGRKELHCRLLNKAAADCLAMYFGNSLEGWEEHCKMISQNDFAMGRTVTRSNFQLWFKAAITEKSIIEIRNRHVSKSSYASPSDLPKRTVAIVASPIQKIIESDEPEAIKNVRKKLVETLSPEVYKSWFSKVEMRISGDLLVLNVPTKFDGDWIAEKYEGNIKSIAESLGLRFLIVLPQRPFVEAKIEAAMEKPKQGIASSLFRVPAFTDVPKYVDPNSGDILAKKAQFARMAG